MNLHSSDENAAFAPFESSSPPAAVPELSDLQLRLQSLIDGARESWTYAIFWEYISDDDPSGQSLLGWGDGYYYEGETTTPVRAVNPEEQDHRKRVLQELISLINGGNDAVEDDLISYASLLFNSVRMLFNSGDGALPLPPTTEYRMPIAPTEKVRF